MEAVVQQYFEIHKKELFLKNDRLLQKIMSQDVMICVMNSTAVFDDVHLEMQSSESCVKCLDLDAELLNKQNVYNDLSKSYSQLKKHCISLELTMQLNQEIFQKDSLSNNQNALEIPKYFENNDLKAQLQAKDTTICKLKEHIKSMRENDKEEKVKQDMGEIETINIELEHSVAKLLYENERLHKEIEHLKKIYKDQFDSIKKTRALSKEHGDSLIAQLNSKSMENKDLKHQIQDKVFVITLLKNDLRKLKGKEIVENAAQLPIATTIAPCMIKIDLDPLAPRITPKTIVHLKETTSNSVETPKPKIKVYSRRPKQIKSIDSSKKDKIVESKIANNSKPNQLWGSNATDVPSSSSRVNDSKFLGTVRFRNDQVAKTIGYGSRDTNLYTISLDDMLKTSPICILSKGSKTKSWLWHCRLSYLNFGTLNKLAIDGLARGIPKFKFQKDHLCSPCALGKIEKSSHQPKAEETNQKKLYLLHMDLCGPMRVDRINGKKYILVIVDDYS
ncbi:retrovirus-related pol polyprotein from transposon TNT 1-94 [Tanacetum coccineum]